MRTGNLQDRNQGNTEAEKGYAQESEYAWAFGIPNGAACRCLSIRRRFDPKAALYLGVWIPTQDSLQAFGSPTWGYVQALGSPAGATYSRLDAQKGLRRSLNPQPGLQTGVYIPNRGYTQVFGVPNG